MDNLKEFQNLNHDKPSYSEYSKPIPPRKFPKKEYNKLNRHIWLGLILILLLTGSATYYGVNYIQGEHSQEEAAQSYKPPKTHKVYKFHKSNRHKLIQPKDISSKYRNKSTNSNQGSLKTWLKKLGYPTAKSKSIMTIYKNAQPFRKRQINQQLTRINHLSLNKRVKAQQVIRLLRQYQMIDQGSAAISR